MRDCDCFQGFLLVPISTLAAPPPQTKKSAWPGLVNALKPLTHGVDAWKVLQKTMAFRFGRLSGALSVSRAMKRSVFFRSSTPSHCIV